MNDDSETTNGWFLSFFPNVSDLHERFLPIPISTMVGRFLLLQNVEYAEEWLCAIILILVVYTIIQTKALTRPPPVPQKRLPKRPCIAFQFQPDDPVTTNLRNTNNTNNNTTSLAAALSSQGISSTTSTTATTTATSALPKKKKPSFIQRMDGMFPSAKMKWSSLSRHHRSRSSQPPPSYGGGNRTPTTEHHHHDMSDLEDEDDTDDNDDLLLTTTLGNGASSSSGGIIESSGGSQSVTSNQPKTPPPPPPPPPPETSATPTTENDDEFKTTFGRMLEDLPDSFAPLLSSSHMTVLTDLLTADLVHAVQVEAGIRLRPGRHEIPLDKDQSRPQLILHVPSNDSSGGCRISAVAVVGSDGLSLEQDMEIHRSTTSRSQPMVKHAGIVLDPPLPLLNVAPTLIHFPTLFEDRNMIPILRSIQLLRFIVDFIVSISSFLEQCLWILESQCQIHLSKVRITPLYKGQQQSKSKSQSQSQQQVEQQPQSHQRLPEWRLQLAFSGHVLLFGWIPIPFISVTLPSFIIPQPHALLEFLISSQPLASAHLRRENIAEQRIALAILNTVETWNTQLKLVATPPAVAVDVTLPGGVSCAVEMGFWRDHHAGRNQRETTQPNGGGTRMSHMGGAESSFDDAVSINSMSSWTTKNDPAAAATSSKRNLYNMSSSAPPQFDANHLVPWLVELSAKGTISHEKMSFHVLKFSAVHEGGGGGVPIGSSTVPPSQQKSQFVTQGSFAVWKLRPSRRPSSESGSGFMGGKQLLPPHASSAAAAAVASPMLPRRRPRSAIGKATSHPELETLDSPSVAAIFLYPDETSSFHSEMRMLQYDYVFDVADDSKIDAVTISIGATHPMLNGGTMITTIFDSIYAFGSVAAHEDSILDPIERRRKRNILRHLPATDFTFGIQNIFIPPESESFSDDGQTLFLPDIEGGRMMVRFLGGMEESDGASVGSNGTVPETVLEGIKLVADFEIPSLVMHAETTVKEFPELDIHEGVKLHTQLAGVIGGSVKAHLRPQKLITAATSTTPSSLYGPNVFNPLEAYEIDFSRSSLSVKMKEFSTTLGHRRVMFPAETSFYMKVAESVVDMGFEGNTKCELSWDFQGLSPILQVTSPGQSPADAPPENKEQVSLLISPLRQGRFSLSVSSVGGISITKAATSRDDKEGLYDWKFFNALISPDEESKGRIVDVLHDRPTMNKLLQVVKLVNEDLHKFLRYSIDQFRRAKEILDQEGVLDPGHAIPMYKMARLISLFLTGDVKQVDTVLPIVRRVVAGDGLDVVKTKDLLRQHLDSYDAWAPEIDRAVSWAAAALGPFASAQPYVEDQVTPLAEQLHNAAKFEGIPSASQLYETLLDEPHLPLDPDFSNLVSRVAPYLSFKQVEYILDIRASADWQPSDLRRIRYVYSIKRKIREIAESYGGLSFLPQSFFLSVFLGEATRTSLRASRTQPDLMMKRRAVSARSVGRSRLGSATGRRSNSSTLSKLRRRRRLSLNNKLQQVEEGSEEMIVSSSNQLSMFQKSSQISTPLIPKSLVLPSDKSTTVIEHYELGDSLLGPQDVAILLQAGLTSVMKSSTVVQLNQRMLLDLICSQPRTFAVAVLAQIGNTPRGLTSALMALLELDQTAFKVDHQIDMHALLESWLPELKIPRREDHMAGGRWARQSYYDALFAVSVSIIDDAETYMALKGHLQRVRLATETEPLPQSIEERIADVDSLNESDQSLDASSSKHEMVIQKAKSLISAADDAGRQIIERLVADEKSAKSRDSYEQAIALYRDAFDACAAVLAIDKHAFQTAWFADFYKRNYDALMVLSMYDNVMDNVDNVRHWLGALLRGSRKAAREQQNGAATSKTPFDRYPDSIFDEPEKYKEQELLDAILEATIYEVESRERLRTDPLVRLIIRNPPGHYDFVIVSAAGVVTDGKKGLELKDAFERLEEQRGVKVIRADTATARSIKYNATKVEEAIEAAVHLKKPYGLLGYSQGCANALMAESMLLSGTPRQQLLLSKSNGGLVCRQLLFSAANGSFHATAMDRKVQRLISMCEDFFKSQAGYFSRAFASSVLESLNSMLDSAHFHKTMGGAQSFLPDGCRAFWREAQHLADVPTCTIRGVMEPHTTPECLEMLSNLLTKQSGSALHDSQVHVFDAVGHPVYHLNRNGRLLKRCAIGEGAVQRTHHWSPLSYEVEFVRTLRDVDMASFDCAKDRHVFPWVEVNKRFGFIKFTKEEKPFSCELHPSKLVTG